MVGHGVVTTVVIGPVNDADTFFGVAPKEGERHTFL